MLGFTMFFYFLAQKNLPAIENSWSHDVTHCDCCSNSSGDVFLYALAAFVVLSFVGYFFLDLKKNKITNESN